jgi:hypothetical protein
MNALPRIGRDSICCFLTTKIRVMPRFDAPAGHDIRDSSHAKIRKERFYPFICLVWREKALRAPFAMTLMDAD